MIVCEPVIRDDSDVGLPSWGNCGRPSDVVSTTVPVSGGIVWPAAMSASSCAGVLAGSVGAACAVVMSEPAMMPPVAIVATAGTAHLARLDSFGTCMVSHLPFRLRVHSHCALGKL